MADSPSEPARRLRRCLGALAVLLAALVTGPRTRAQTPAVIRMATLVPDGSSWHLVLKGVAARWKEVSGGRVTVRLFPGGVAGDDPEVVSKMRRGTLNAGVLTSVGVAEIDRAVYATGIPLMYESYDEAYWVHEKMRPKIEAKIEASGFVVLNWIDGGWAHFFATKSVAVPDDLRAQRLFSGSGGAEAAEVWRSAGVTPVPLPATELAAALQGGRVEVLLSTPQIAVLSGVFTHARHMTALRWQLLQGATLITRESWEKVPSELRPQFLEIAREAGARLRQEIRDAEVADLDAMKKRGLVVVPLSVAQRAQWQTFAESLYPGIRARIVPAAAFDEAMRYREEYRKSRRPGPAR